MSKDTEMKRKIQLEENNEILGRLNGEYSTYDHFFMLELLSESFGDHWVYFLRGDREYICNSWDETKDFVNAFIEDEDLEKFWDTYVFDVSTMEKIMAEYPGLATIIPK